MRIPLVLLIVMLGQASSLPAAELSDQLAALVAQAPAGSQISLAVIDCDGGEWLFRHDADTPLRMASLAKLFVSAASLVELGPDHRFTTELLALGPRTGDRIPGLGILPSGSPCLDEHFTDRQPDRLFAAWAEQLHAAGIRHIAGDLVVDDSLFSGPIRPSTYPADHANAQRWYSAPASAFAFNDNCIEVRVVPAAAGQPATVEVRPSSPRISVRNKTRSVSQGGSKGLVVSRDHHANTVTVSGSYSSTTSWFPLAIHDQPDLLAADHLAAALRSRGIVIEGEVRTGRVDPSAGPSLLRHEDPLLPALAILNQRSQNFYGEQLIRVLGARRSGSGSIAAGTRAVPDILGQHLGLDLTRLGLLDGSGLSYDNQASAALVCRLLAALHRHPQGGLYRETLKDKWHGHTLAKVKTGSLAVARCLAGYIRGPEGRYYAFAILLNRADASSIGWANHLRDKSFKTMCEALGSTGPR